MYQEWEQGTGFLLNVYVSLSFLPLEVSGADVQI